LFSGHSTGEHDHSTDEINRSLNLQKSSFSDRLESAEFGTVPSREFDLHAIGHRQNHKASVEILDICDVVQIDCMAATGQKENLLVQSLADTF
jgi:hypothetical protein